MAAGAARGLLGLLVLSGLLAGAAATSPNIIALVSVSSGKLILSCNMTAPHASIEGHEWMRGDKALQTDTESSAFTSYTLTGNTNWNFSS